MAGLIMFGGFALLLILGVPIALSDRKSVV